MVHIIENGSTASCTSVLRRGDDRSANGLATSPRNHPNFNNIGYAVELFKRELKFKGFRIVHESMENNARDGLVWAEKDRVTTTFYVKFKRDFFHDFGIIFPSEKGYGESINCDLLDKLIDRKIDVLVFAHSPHFYTVYPLQIKNYCEAHGLVRVQDVENFYNRGDFTGKLAPVHERTYCFPLELLKNFLE